MVLATETREQEADRLLAVCGKRQAIRGTRTEEVENPVYTEMQLARHGEYFVVASVDDLIESLPSGRPSTSALEELRFLATVTPLTARERCALRGWLLGCTVPEMRAQGDAFMQAYSQQHISRLLRSALKKLLDGSAVSFSVFSRHSLYRAPVHRRQIWKQRVCPRCGEAFFSGWGAGMYCSTSCLEAARRRE